MKQAAYAAYAETYQKGMVSASLFETLLVYAMDGHRTAEEAIDLAVARYASDPTFLSRIS